MRLHALATHGGSEPLQLAHVILVATVDVLDGMHVGLTLGDDAREDERRAGAKVGNKGFECATGAIELVNLYRQF